ncbi:MAG: peptidoglycan DD-metalloendopeptidase family protein [Deltaproteobacteria bacterium]|nr:MAG: peptidoglycan DD-metalloendopeptidase family protein [Deltaproteobacteria bacterium]UCH08733.1 MAG: peptidoglycan DD-metalloendopeptidase family protein [Deltaproteobacteria bacterium]
MNIHNRVFLSPFCMIAVFLLSSLSGGLGRAQERASGDSDRSQVQQIEKYLQEQEGELESVHGKERDLLGQLETLEKDVAEQKKAIRGLTDRIQEVSQEIGSGQERIQKLNIAAMAVEKALQKRLVAFYKFGRPGYLRLLVTATSLQEFQKTIKYAKALMAQDRIMLDTLGERRSQVEHEVQRLKENMGHLEALREAKDQRIAFLEETIEKKVFLLMRVHREKEFYGTAIKELRGAAQALSEAVVCLESQERQELLTKGFAEMKGRLSMPVKGKILRDMKLVRSNPFMHRKGVYITGPPGEEVRAVFPGRVDFSGWFKGYGQLIIVNHGSHYFTIFAHLDERMRETGDMVEADEPLGLVGNPGWDAGPGVYFEIRKGSEHLDPNAWLNTG